MACMQIDGEAGENSDSDAGDDGAAQSQTQAITASGPVIIKTAAANAAAAQYRGDGQGAACGLGTKGGGKAVVVDMAGHGETGTAAQPLWRRLVLVLNPVQYFAFGTTGVDVVRRLTMKHGQSCIAQQTC